MRSSNLSPLGPQLSSIREETSQRGNLIPCQVKMLLTSPFISPLQLHRPHPHPNGGGATAARTALTIQAAKQLTGRVVTTKANKTVGVEVVRLAPHPKYHRRERIKKKYQAHDPDNQFKVGDVVELIRSRPISKTKHFLAVPVPPRDTRRKAQLLPPLQSQADAAASAPQDTPPSQ